MIVFYDRRLLKQQKRKKRRNTQKINRLKILIVIIKIKTPKNGKTTIKSGRA